MTFKRIQKIVPVYCPRCTGSGYVATKHGAVICPAPGCKDGWVDKIVNEIVHEGEITNA